MDETPSPQDASSQNPGIEPLEPGVDSGRLNTYAHGNGSDIDANQPSGDREILSWQASEFIHHQKRPLWYAALLMIVAILTVVGVLTGQWSGLVVLAAMTAAILVYANKTPRILNYSLTESGIMIESKFHSYNQFRSFSVTSDIAWHAIDLDPIKRFAPRLTILFEDKDFDAIVEALSNELPRQDRHPDAIERLTRFLKF